MRDGLERLEVVVLRFGGAAGGRVAPRHNKVLGSSRLSLINL